MSADRDEVAAVMFGDHYPIAEVMIPDTFRRYAAGELPDKSIIGGCIRECYRDADLLLKHFSMIRKEPS